MFVLNFDDIDKRNQAVEHLSSIGCTLNTLPTPPQSQPQPPSYPGTPLSFYQTQTKPKGSSHPTVGSQSSIADKFPIPALKAFPPPSMPPPLLPMSVATLPPAPFQVYPGRPAEKPPVDVDFGDNDDNLTVVAPEEEDGGVCGNVTASSEQLSHIQAIVKSIMQGVSTIGGKEVGRSVHRATIESSCQTEAPSVAPPPLSFDTLIDMVKSGYADPEIESLLFDDADGFDQLVLTVAERMGIPKGN